MSRRPRSLRLRVTGALAIASVIGIALSAVIGILLTQRFLSVSTANGLRTAADSVHAATRNISGRVIPVQALQSVVTGNGAGVVYIGDGQVLARYRTSTAVGDALSRRAARGDLASPTALPGDRWAYAVDVQDDGFVVRTADGRQVQVSTVVLIDDTSRQTTVLGALIGANSLGGAVGLTALIVIVVLLLGRALRPLGTMADRAEALAAGDRSARLPSPGGDPLVDRLAVTVNSAFDSQDEAEQRVRSFVADASHELRTPLTVASGWVGLDLQGGLPDPDRHREAMERVATQLDRMRALIEDLALLARTDEGRGLALAGVELGALARDAVADARVVWPEATIAIIGDEIAAPVVGDQQRLAQVVRNLLANAVQHTPPGTLVTVTVASDDATARCRLEIADDGPGIPPDALPHVFERFWRGDTSRQRLGDGSGTGLGLAIVQSIVAAHGGAASVDSGAGHGTTFRIVLPRA